MSQTTSLWHKHTEVLFRRPKNVNNELKKKKEGVRRIKGEVEGIWKNAPTHLY